MRDATADPDTTREAESPGDDPAEGKPDMSLPGADHPAPAPDKEPDKDDDLPERLRERIGEGAGGIATGEPDLLPNVEVPAESM